ncbi:MAG TPA: cell wall-binding repeat-containing protein [Coriobacteriia bacterium]
MARYGRMSALVLALVLVLSPVAGASAVNGHPREADVREATYFGADAYDAVDATWRTAPTLPPVSRHVFASLPPKFLLTRDEDWFKVKVASAGTPIVVNVQRLSGQGGSYLDVYGSTAGSCDATSLAFAGTADPNNAPPLLGAQSPAGWWDSGMTSMYFVAPRAGTYYFRHRPAAGGTGAGYSRDSIANVANTSAAYEIHVIVGDADRIAGPSRYGTSVAVSRQMWNAADDPWWWEGPWGNGVILASGQNFADGLAATSLSLRTGMPILLTAQQGLPGDVRAEIDRLGTANKWRVWAGDNTFTVYICGSEVAISDAVQAQLEADPYVTAVKRLEGRDRFETAALIADEASAAALYKRLVLVGGAAPATRRPTEAFVINGAAWADGLAAGPVAAFADAPVLMVTATSLPKSTREWIVGNGITSVHVVGGPSVVATSVMTAIASLSTTPTVDRIAGASRYETAYRVARYGVDNYGMSGKGCTVVSGESPWDALSAGQLSFMTYTPLLLTPRTGLSPWVTLFHDGSAGFAQPSYVVGGEPAVGAAAYNQLRDLWKRTL